MTTISVIMPVHDQADHIEAVVRGHVGALRRMGGEFEVVLVPNACTDESEAIAARLDDELPEVRNLPIDLGGWGRAVRAGIAASAGDIVCYTNSARTSPEILVLVLTYARVYPEVVVKANRRVRDNWFRKLGSLLYNLECRALLQLPVWDINGTPKAFPRAFESLLALERDDDLIDLEFIGRCVEHSYPILEVPVLETTRLGGSSTTSLISALRLYAGAFEIARRSRAERGA